MRERRRGEEKRVKGEEKKREKERETQTDRQRNMDLLFHLFMCSLVASYKYPDGGSNPQPWRIETML